MPIGGSATELNITGAKLKVSGGVKVSGSIAYTTDATGFGSVTAQIDGNNTLNVTSGKNTGVTKIERATAATITAITHTNVNNNTTIHIALKNTSTTRGVFIILETFASDDTVKVNYTDDYMIGPGETGMLTLRKVNGVLSLFAREMFSSKATSFDATDNSPFYIKDGVNYKYPLYKYTASGLTSITINGTEYFRPNAGITTKSRPPKGLPDNTPVPSGTLKIGNIGDFSTINYDVYSTGTAEAGSLYRGSTQKARFGLDTTHNEASGSFTDSGVSSGDTYTLYLDKTATTSTDTVSTSTQSNQTHEIAFHHGTFTSTDYSSAYSSVSLAAAAGRIYSDTETGTYTWGTLGSNAYTSGNTTYTFTPVGGTWMGTDVLMVAGGGAGGTQDAGGGGAGGLLHHTNQNLSGIKTIVVGNGGTSTTSSSALGGNGNNTSMTGFDTVIGGGGGGSGPEGGGSDGGSGGGGGAGTQYGASNLVPGTATTGQGNDGGSGRSDSWAGGGGGGAGEAGEDATGNEEGGNGGNGVDKSSVFGTTYGVSGVFAGGGGGAGTTSVGTGGTGGGGAGHGGSSSGNNGEDGQKHSGGGGGASRYASTGIRGGTGGSGIVVVKFSGNIVSGKNIPKVTGISFTSSNIVFTVQQDSGTSITHVKYSVNGGSEVTTPVGTLSVAHSLSSSASITVVAWAVDTSGNQLSAKKTVTGTIP